jgi:hypothetical protein
VKVTVTHLKAPWPTGCVPGDVVDLCADAIPAWAAGKCVPADDEAPAAHSLAPATALVVNPEQPDGASAEMQAIEAQAVQEKAAIEARAGKARAAKG